MTSMSDLRTRAEAEDLLLEMVRGGGEAVARAARGPAQRLQVIGADGEPVRRDFGGELRVLTADWRLSESVGLRAVDSVLSGWELPRWSTVEQVPRAEDVHAAGVVWVRAVAEVAARIAAHGRAVKGSSDALAWRAVAAGPLPEEARELLEPARAALTTWARCWLGHAGTLSPELRVQQAREVAA